MKNSAAKSTKEDDLPLAVSVIIFTVFALSLGDAVVKLTSNTFVLWQIFVVRSIIAIPCLLIFMRVGTQMSLHLPVSLWWTVLRSFLLVAMWVSYYIALPKLSLSVAAAAYYTLPIFITLFSAAIVCKQINRTGWIAVLLGFVGVLLILQPNTTDFNWYAFLPLLSAILYALAMILTRTKCRAEHPLLLSLSLNFAFVIVGSVAALVITTLPGESRTGFLLAQWSSMHTKEWFAMVLLAIVLLIGSIGAAVAYQNGPSSTIGIFDFAYVGFAVLWSVLLFSDVPDVISIVGIVLIVIAGILSLWR